MAVTPSRQCVTISRAVSTAMRVGNWKSVAKASRARMLSTRRGVGGAVMNLQRQVALMSRLKETKEGSRKVVIIQLPHNNITVLAMNPYHIHQ
jgi:hypothetical protein